jgi:hypothetical protein
MPVFFSDRPVTHGGKTFLKLTSHSYSLLESYYSRYNGSFIYADPEIRKQVDEGRQSPEKMNELAKYAYSLKWSSPGRRVGLTTTREPIQILTEVHNKWILENQKMCKIPEDYLPVLNMLMRQEFARTCPGGYSPEMRKFYDSEIRGKVIDLIRRPRGLGVIENPVHSDLKFLNNLLENIDLGRRSDLNLYSNSSPDPLSSAKSKVELSEIRPTGKSFAAFLASET